MSEATLDAPPVRLWPALGGWAIAAAVLTVSLIESMVRPLEPGTLAYSVARLTAYITSGLTSLLFVASAFAFGLVLWAVLRFVEVPARFSTVMGCLAAGIWVLAAYSAVSAALLLLAPPPTVASDVLEVWQEYQEAFLAQEPLRTIWRLRAAASVGAALAVGLAVRRRVRCGWGEAALGVLGAAAVLAAFATLLRLLTNAVWV